jgi:hypothetical protein
VTTTPRTVPWNLDDLSATPLKNLIELFLTLPSPSLDETRGEFDGHSPAYLGEMDSRYREVGLGRWLGKGYASEPLDQWAGHGYNIWDTGHGVVRRTRFGWSLGSSALDRGACLVMHYRAFASVLADLDVIDEIRRVKEGIYLGIVTTREPSFLCPHPGGPDGRSYPSTFLLSGPVRPWIGPDNPPERAASA